MDTWNNCTKKKKKKYKHASLIKEKHKEKEKGNKEKPLAWSTSSSWEDVLGFKEIYAIIFKTKKP